MTPTFPPFRAAWFAAVTLLALLLSPFLHGQANSTNIAGSGNNLQATASNAAIIAGSTATNGGTNSAIIGAANSIVPGGTRFAFIGAGNYNNMAAGSHSAAMLAGFSNALAAGAVRGATIGGGFNTNAGRSAVILGGEFNIVGVNSTGAAVVAGIGNAVGSDAVGSTIGGGEENFITNRSGGSVIGGGISNTVSATNVPFEGTSFPAVATVGGGLRNTASGQYATVGGGANNTASGWRSAVAGGQQNTAGGDYAQAGGGWLNTASGNYAAIGGGQQNTASNWNSTIGGGAANAAGGTFATVGGGYGNTAGGDYATVPGGSENDAEDDYSFAAGRRAKTTGQGQFVWADSQEADFAPPWFSPNDTFSVRARGGTMFTSGLGGGNQIVSWAPGAGSWSFTSDAAAKEDFRSVDARGILRRIAALPITEWRYIGHPQRHIGPMAQDWHAAFPLNTNSKAIDTADLHGVSLAAIQGLVQELEERDKAIGELRAKLQAVEERLNSLPPAPNSLPTTP